MCRVPVQLRESVKRRLAAAAEEIFELLERTIAEYEEQLVSKYEQRRRQGALYTHDDLHCDSPVGAVESSLCELPKLKRNRKAPPLQTEAPPLQTEAPPLQPPHIEAPPLQHEAPPVRLPQSEDILRLKQEQEALDVTDRVCEVAVKTEERLSDFEARGVFPLTDQQEALSHAWTEESLDVDPDALDCGAPPSPPGGAKGRKRRIHECPLCCLRFQSTFNLETHLRVHTGERPFSCSVCGKTFNRKDSLNNHRKIHAGETFCCAECGKRYSDKSNLRRHVLSTHGAREPRPLHPLQYPGFTPGADA